ncbi:MAG: ATP-dependent DNA helicase [Deltaproteobacteria bacterium]|nr:ATP-dependent DNA helicase [Deltaproteobacteria bacterium]
MAIWVDLEQRRITGGIRDLAVSLEEGPRGVSLLGRVRAELGTRIHQEYRQEKSSEDAFTAERSLALRLELDGFSVEIKGRADGWFEQVDGICIEEVKSVLSGGGELSKARAEFFPEFCLQLRLYGLAARQELPQATLKGKLLLVSILDGAQRSLDVPLETEATRILLERLLRKQITQAEEAAKQANKLAAVAGKLRMPYAEARPHQNDLQALMEQGLAQDRPVLAMAPTGIGKTVSALLAGLGHSLANEAILMFLTAKTTQQDLVVQTFADICQAAELAPGEIQALTLRAKERMCPPGHLLCHPHLCPLLADFDARLQSSKIKERILGKDHVIDPDQVFAMGDHFSLCPFSLQLALLPHVQLVVGDYNYVYDPGIALMGLFGQEAHGQVVVVVDEAHNLFDRAREMYSPCIERSELRLLGASLARGDFLAETDRTDQLALDLDRAVDGPALFDGLHRLLGDLDSTLDSALLRSEDVVSPVPDQSQRPVDPEAARWQDLADRAAELIVAYVLYNRLHRIVHRRDPMLDLLARLGLLRDLILSNEKEFVHWVRGPKAEGGAAIGVACLNPAKRLAQRHAQVEGTVAMSATLTPLTYYSDVLGLSGLEPILSSLPSPFPTENLCVRILPSLSTTYREREQHKQAVARAIEDLVTARPGNHVAFFPSFRYLSMVQPLIKLPMDSKQLIQLPGMPQAARERMLDTLRAGDGKTRLLLAVMGGAFAEGVDLPGTQLIGAVVVGPGLPQISFERSLMQGYFQEEYEQGFAYAMLYPGMQRVIQAAGRVIRTPDDEGVIVLLGRRFAEEEMGQCLPEHWYRHRPTELITGDLTASLTEFWDGR